jgi:hypothetical protein
MPASKPMIMLQSAWSTHYKSMDDWPYYAWLLATFKSHTGRRLKRILSGDLKSWDKYYFTNSTKVITGSPAGKPPIDVDHVKKELTIHKPPVVLACGLQAELALCKAGWHGSVVAIPHPAYKMLTNVLLDAAKERFEQAMTEHTRVTFRQERGKFSTRACLFLPTIETNDYDAKRPRNLCDLQV